MTGTYRHAVLRLLYHILNNRSSLRAVFSKNRNKKATLNKYLHKYHMLCNVISYIIHLRIYLLLYMIFIVIECYYY